MTRQSDRIQRYRSNPRYWQYRGRPVVLLGGTVEDNLHQIPNLEEHLDLLASVGGNYIRNVMSCRDEGNVWPFGKVNGKYDLDRWDEEHWARFDRMLELTKARDIIVQIEVWAFHDFNRGVWPRNPWRPANNVNYTTSETTLSNEAVNIGKRPHGFFSTVPRLNNDAVVLEYQRKFVDRMLSHTLKHDHVLYCMTNEIHPQFSPEWGWYWATYIKERAASAGTHAETSEMFWQTDLTHEQHRASLDHPEIYSYFEASQNSAVTGQANWDNFQFVYEYLKSDPRPANHVKIYGADTGPAWASDDDEAVDRFWRNIMGGMAASRFHRPPTGLGLNEKAQANIRSMRMLLRELDIFESRPQGDLLSNRRENAAYATANPGRQYAVYFPQVAHRRGADLRPNGEPVEIDLSAAGGDLKAKWLDIPRSEWSKEEDVRGGTVAALTPPGKGPRAVVMLER